jgi:hypothetical protein
MDLRPTPSTITCPECDGEITKRGNGMRTLVAGRSGYDDTDQYHNHDPNWSTSILKCENGHRIKRSTRRKCPANDCDFGGETKMEIVE